MQNAECLVCSSDRGPHPGMENSCTWALNQAHKGARQSDDEGIRETPLRRGQFNGLGCCRQVTCGTSRDKSALKSDPNRCFMSVGHLTTLRRIREMLVTSSTVATHNCSPPAARGPSAVSIVFPLR